MIMKCFLGCMCCWIFGREFLGVDVFFCVDSKKFGFIFFGSRRKFFKVVNVSFFVFVKWFF